MARDPSRVSGTLHFGEDGVVYATRIGHSGASEARCLAVERTPRGEVESAVLDRLIHQPHEARWGDFSLHGRFVTELRRVPAGA